MGFRFIATFNGLQQVFYLTAVQLLFAEVILAESDITPQREHTADRGFYLVNGAFIVLQQRAAIILSHRPQHNDGNSASGANVHGAVFAKKVSVGEIQLLGHFENIPGRQDDVRPVNAAFAALGAVERKGVVKADGERFDILEHFFVSHENYPP